jgi:hypothetical protein
VKRTSRQQEAKNEAKAGKKIKHEVRNPQQGKTKQRRKHAPRTNRMKISYKNVIDISDLKTYQQTMNMKWNPNLTNTENKNHTKTEEQFQQLQESHSCSETLISSMYSINQLL